MKSICLTLFIILSNLISHSQINTLKIIAEKDVPLRKPYDSTMNFLGYEVLKYVGQELYIKPQDKRLQKYGYNGFYSDFKKGKGLRKIYKLNSENASSNYNELVGKYFKVINVFDNYINNSEKRSYVFEIIEKENGERVFYKYDPDTEEIFPFLIVGFIEKQKKLLGGKYFNFYPKDMGKNFDYETGKPIKTNYSEKWRFIDLLINEDNGNLSLFLESDSRQKTLVNFNYGIKKINKTQ